MSALAQAMEPANVGAPILRIQPRQRYLKRFATLKTERSSWDATWRECSDYILPTRSRWLSSDRNKGTRRNNKIINNTAMRAAEILAAGMMSGLTSPARPWFRLSTPDPLLAEQAEVRSWLFRVESIMRTAIARSNVYQCFHQMYGDLATFGTAVLYLDEDDDDVFRGYVLPVGRYSLANDAAMRVSTCYREVTLTVEQMVEQFSLNQVSQKVRDAYNRGDYDLPHDVLHVLEPNRMMRKGAIGPDGMRFHSCWMEQTGDMSTGFLRREGYHESPVMAPRWAVTAEDVYGTSPGMKALGDARAVQLYEKRKAQAVEYIIKPALRGPVSLHNASGGLDTEPGGITYVDSPVQGGASFGSVWDVNHGVIPVIEESIRKHEERMNSSFHADLWQMMSQLDAGRMTAREVVERSQEKMSQLGPVLEQLNGELFDPFIERCFNSMNRRGMFPQPPAVILEQKSDVQVEYISVLAQAQKMQQKTPVQDLAAFVLGLAQAQPSVLDKLNLDEMVDDYADSLGTKPELVRSDEEVAQMRAARVQEQQQQKAAEAMALTTQTAQSLSQTSMEGDTALSRMVNGLSGVAAANQGLPS